MIMEINPLGETLADLCLIVFALICIGIFLVGGVWAFILAEFLADNPMGWVFLIVFKVIVGIYVYITMRPYSHNRIMWLFVGYLFPIFSLIVAWYNKRKDR